MASKYTDYCSFCGRGKSEVDVLIAGEIASICNECAQQAIDYSREALAAKKGKKKTTAKHLLGAKVLALFQVVCVVGQVDARR